MSTPFFKNPDRIAQLQFHAATWLGTPFMPNAAIKGAGVSCQKLVGTVLIECAALPKGFDIPEGPMNWSAAHKDSLIEKFFAGQPDFFLEMDRMLSQPGDVVGFQLGGCVHHLGIILDERGQFIHCLRGNGVAFNNLHDASYWTRLARVWRPVMQ